MGLFGSSSPFDDAIEKTTNEMNTETDWGLILSLCDKIKETPDGPRKFVNALIPKINHKVPHVSMQALVVLDCCVNNCGKDFRKEVASQSFCEGLKEFLYSYKTKKVTRKLCYLIRKWAEEFKEDPELSHFVSFYYMLRGDGIEFPADDEDEAKKPKEPVSNDPNVVSSQQEADDIARAIEESLKEEQRKGRGTTQIASSPASIYPSVLGGSTSTSTSYAGASYASSAGNLGKRKVKALYDFEAAEDNELTFKTGDIVTILDDSDPNWWKGQGSNGVGLFPANFVTNDLTAPVESETENQVVDEQKEEREPVVKFSDEPQVKEVDQSQPVLEINPDLIDQTLAALQSTDPETTVSDPPELLRDEETCTQMGKLIDSKLEELDRKHLSLTMLNEKILESLKLYDELMNQQPAIPTFSQSRYLPGHPPYGAPVHGQAPVMVGSYPAGPYHAQQYMVQGTVSGAGTNAPGPSGGQAVMAPADLKTVQAGYDPMYQQSAQPPNTTGYHVTNGHAPPGDLSQQQGMNQQPSSYAMTYDAAPQSTAASNSYSGHFPPGVGYGNPPVMSQYDQQANAQQAVSAGHYVTNQALPPALM